MRLQAGFVQVKRELIDTLWNVNLTNVPVYRPGHGELIDTLWNVNLDDNADDFEYFVN